MATGKNMVVLRTDAILTLIAEEMDRFPVKMDNPEDVKDKVLWLCNHPKEAKIMKEKILDKVIRGYDISRVVEQYTDLLVNIYKPEGVKCRFIFSVYDAFQDNERRAA